MDCVEINWQHRFIIQYHDMSKQEKENHLIYRRYTGTESDLVVISQMAEKDESRTNSDLNYNESGSSYKDEEASSWLQLSIGSCSQTPTMAASSSHQHPSPTAHAQNLPHHQDINWPFSPHTITMGMPSSSSLRPLFLGSYFQFPAATTAPGFDISGPSSRVRVVDLPRSRRPHSGIWFMLQASHNQLKEPFLPQIPKSYLRIKDGRMTIRLLIKYLVNKLRLESESEIEIRCRGQQLVPFMTLQHVRDTIWSLRDTFLSQSSTTDHIMVLHYGRSA